MSNKEKTSYETIVVKNPSSNVIPREICGDEVAAWSKGHQLRRLTAFENVVEKIANGEIKFPSDYAARFLDRMKSYGK